MPKSQYYSMLLTLFRKRRFYSAKGGIVVTADCSMLLTIR